MSSARPEPQTGDVCFIYDGDCPICTMAAEALRIRQAVGSLYLLNARENSDHPLIREVNTRRLDLDEGMVLVFQGRFYHGRDALHLMAMLGSRSGWFSRAIVLLFRSKTLSRLCYPSMRATRNLLLRLKGVRKIGNLATAEPPFKAVFGADWDRLPPVLKRHYDFRAGEAGIIEGRLDVTVSPLAELLAKLTGMLISRSGKDVPVTVRFSVDPEGGFHFDRTFHFPGHKPQIFRSRMVAIGGDEMIEFMRFGIGWKLAYAFDGEKVVLSHRGYVWRVLGLTLPAPFGLLFGRGHAEEVAIDQDRFRMWTHAKHPLLGVAFAYAGEFRFVEDACGTS